MDAETVVRGEKVPSHGWRQRNHLDGEEAHLIIQNLTTRWNLVPRTATICLWPCWRCCWEESWCCWEGEIWRREQPRSLSLALREMLLEGVLMLLGLGSSSGRQNECWETRRGFYFISSKSTFVNHLPCFLNHPTVQYDTMRFTYDSHTVWCFRYLCTVVFVFFNQSYLLILCMLYIYIKNCVFEFEEWLALTYSCT